MKRSFLRLLLPTLLLSAGVTFSAGADPGLFGGKKKKAAAAAAAAKPDSTAKKKTAYDRIVAGPGVIASRSGFISTYIQGGKLYFEIPIEYLGREMLLGTLTSETSSPGVPDQGYFMESPMQVMFIQKDSTILLEKKNTSQISYPDGESYAKALQRNYLNEIFKKFKIEGYNADSTAVLINVTDLFLRDEKELSPWGKPAQSGMMVNGKLKDANTILLGTKTFMDNVMVETDMSYTVSRKYKMSSGGMSMTVDYPDIETRLKVKRTLALLPENKMHPRQSDRRMGIFMIPSKKKITEDKDFMHYYSLASRWRVEPADTAAWLRGELVEPARQIVWYIDDAFPADWIEPITNGILRWNKAFEKIGFKNVMAAKVFPEDDPEFDPDNLKYSCLRYIPSSTANAMGPSWWDYDTGEILNASVVVYSDISSLLYKWRLIQTGQADPTVRADKLPRNVFDESLEYVVAHEIGHTLGLMHNMSASAAYPVDSLRSPSFTAEYGTTPSIMDYARFNYVAQPEDGVTVLGPPDLGVYDYFAIKWLYEPVIGKTAKEEAAILDGWLDEKEGDPMYHYGVQQMMSYYDPRSLTEDLGDDPIKASEYGIKNLKYILPQLPGWIDNDPNNTQKFSVYGELVNQYNRYLANVFMVVGGININNVKDGPGVTRFEPVSRARQKEAMAWVMGQLRDYEWINDTPIRYNHALAVDPSISLLRSMFNSRMLGSSTISKIVLSAHLSDDPYTLREYSDDLYSLVFYNSIRGRKLTEGDKYMQRVYCDRVNALVKPKGSSLFGLAGEREVTVDQLKELVSHDEFERIRDEVHHLTHDGECGHIHVSTEDHMWCCSPIGLGGDSPSQMSAYGYQGQVNVNDINEWNSYLVDKAPQLESLLRSRVALAHPDDRAHYRRLLYLIQKDR